MDAKQRDHENNIDQLQAQLNFVTENRYNAEASIHQFERNEEEAHSIFHGIQHLFHDIHETFQEGEMNVFISDAIRKLSINNKALAMKMKKNYSFYRIKNIKLFTNYPYFYVAFFYR